jgi:Flp pilus assembly protein TadD
VLTRGRETASLYQDIVKPRQTPVMAHISRGVQYDEIGQHELAIDEFLAAKELEPDTVEVLSHLAAALGALGRFVEADRAIDKALFLDPMSVQA